jgi:hypothetical protein
MSKRKRKTPVQTDAFPTAAGTRRTTFSLPVETADRIARLSRRMGVSQSAFVSELLAEPIAAMASIIDVLPETGATASDVRRARGRSLALIKDVVAQAQSVVEEVESVRLPRRHR